jgi:hypothetical protein
MLSTSGALLCYCDQRKLDWYLAKGIAERLEGEPPTIRCGRGTHLGFFGGGREGCGSGAAGTGPAATRTAPLAGPWLAPLLPGGLPMLRHLKGPARRMSARAPRPSRPGRCAGSAAAGLAATTHALRRPCRLLFEHKATDQDRGEGFYSHSKANHCVACGEGGHYLRYRWAGRAHRGGRAELGPRPPWSRAEQRVWHA